MLDRRKFTLNLIKYISASALIPAAEILNACTYNKKELPKPIEINDKKLSLISPNGGEQFDQVNSIDVSWSSENINLITILISYDGGVAYSYLKKGLNAWPSVAKIDLPSTDIFSDKCFIKIENFEDEKLYDISNQEFSITKGVLVKTITILYPIGNERLVEGSDCLITWDSLNVDFFDIQLFVNGNLWGTLVTNLSEKFYNWNVNSIDSDNVKIKIVDSSNNSISDTTSQSFRIVRIFEIDLTVHSELQNIGGSKIFTSLEFNTFVVKKISSTEYKTISMVCTHNGCIIGIKADQSFLCSCHGSSFDANGGVTNGPANLPLDIFYTEYLPIDQKLLIYN